MKRLIRTPPTSGRQASCGFRTLRSPVVGAPLKGRLVMRVGAFSSSWWTNQNRPDPSLLIVFHTIFDFNSICSEPSDRATATAACRLAIADVKNQRSDGESGHKGVLKQKKPGYIDLMILVTLGEIMCESDGS